MRKIELIFTFLTISVILFIFGVTIQALITQIDVVPK